METLIVTAKPSTREEKVEKIAGNHYRVSVKEPPVKGQANRAIIKALAEFLNITPSRLRIVAGHTSRQKIVEIFD